MLKKTAVVFGLMLSLAFSLCGSYSDAEEAEAGQESSIEKEGVLKDPQEYHLCHRCGMAIKKSDEVTTVTDVPEEPRYQCCPMCLLMDIIECGDGKGKITAYCDKSGEKITRIA